MNDISLERYRNSATFSYSKFLQISNGLNLIFKMLNCLENHCKSIFYAIFEQVVGLMQIIWRWIDIEIAQLFRVVSFSKFVTVFKQF